jgi:hypothetical protein
VSSKWRRKERPARPNRPYWKGYLRLALVTIPVQIHNANGEEADQREEGQLAGSFRLSKGLYQMPRKNKKVESQSDRKTQFLKGGEFKRSADEVNQRKEQGPSLEQTDWATFPPN